MTAVAIQHREQIIEQVRQGRHLQLIADDYSVTPGAISQYLSQDPEYKAARENGAEIRLEHQYQKIDTADDALNLARAREGFRAAAWFAEREFPHRWGAKQQIEHSGTVSLAVLLAAKRERTVGAGTTGSVDAAHLTAEQGDNEHE